MTTILAILNEVVVFVGLCAGIYICCAHIYSLFNTDETKYLTDLLISKETKENAKSLIKRGDEIFSK